MPGCALTGLLMRACENETKKQTHTQERVNMLHGGLMPSPSYADLWAEPPSCDTGASPGCPRQRLLDVQGEENSPFMSLDGAV